VKVDARRLNGPVPGLSLDRFERHAGFAQTRKARVPQLVAREFGDSSALAGTSDDLVQTRGQWIASMRTIQHHEDVSVSVEGRSSFK
jgi:hypothetical protein